jgi:hypothetical protein
MMGTFQTQHMMLLQVLQSKQMRSDQFKPENLREGLFTDEDDKPWRYLTTDKLSC